jgi:predicted GIY-YIG superfamily endonuclease
MTKDEIKKFIKLNASGMTLFVYFGIKNMQEESGEFPKIKDLADYIGYEGQHSQQALGKCIRFLRRHNLVDPNPRSTSKTRKKRVIKSGVYAIKDGNGTYVGQSRDIFHRWKTHSRDIELKIHRYIKSENDVKFLILEECKASELLTKEILWANKLVSQGENILNKENFMFIKEGL